MNCVMNSVGGVMNLLREAYPEAWTRVQARYKLPINVDDEVTLLQKLDEARKAHDSAIAAYGHESEVLPSSEIHQERIVLNTLRKWTGPVFGYTEGSDGRVNVTKLLARKREQDAIMGFVERNEQVGLRLNLDNPLLLYKMRSICSAMLDGFWSEYEVSKPRFGKGSVAEKFSTIKRWDKLAECNSVSEDWCDIGVAPQPRGSEVARLKNVEKQWDKDRLITVEPYVSTYLQHKARVALGRTLINNGYREIVDEGLSGHDGPEQHRRVSLLASAYGSPMAAWGTLDLSDASDNIGYEQVLRVFPADVMAALDRGRSTHFSYKRSDGTTDVRRLYMYGGMGNATTFMVESIMFYALIQAATQLRWRRPAKASVVGDDLLIRGTDAIEATIWGLSALGWRVNLSKSFFGLATSVRESCGTWAFNGSDIYVPPFYGYDDGPKGLIGLAEFIRSAPAGLRDVLLDRVTTWPNTPTPIANTVSVCDGRRAVSTERIRYSHVGMQKLEVKVLKLKPRSFMLHVNAHLGLGGLMGAIARRIASTQVPLARHPDMRRDVLVRSRDRIREQLRKEFSGSFPSLHLHPDTLESVIEGRVDEVLAEFAPDRWTVHVLSVPDPYGMTLTHTWACAHGWGRDLDDVFQDW